MYSETLEGEKSSLLTSAQPCRHFSLAEIQSATKEFDDKLVIGHGGFGKVYKGRIWIEETSHVVAIKRLDFMSNQGAAEFRAEIQMLSKLRHCHLVSLIGFCDDNKEMILVYEYMPHGTLYDHLHKAETPLNWVQRLKIAIGAGRGLDYLHTGVGTQHGVIHRDVKSSNILLDENWAAMISDFGLSKIGPTNQSFSCVDTSVKGTFGYLDPEYFYTRKLTTKTDVYAFGVVLFELLSRRLPVDERYGEELCSLVRWAQKCVKEGKLDQMVDSNIKGTIFPKCLRGFAQIAYRCLRSVPKERPTMAEVVVSLQALLELQQKCDNAAKSPNITGFTWKIHKYLFYATKQKSDPSRTSSPKSLGNNMNAEEPERDSGAGMHASFIGPGGVGNSLTNKYGEVVATDLKWFTYSELKSATRHFGHGISYSRVYKGWVDKTTYFPSKDDTGLPIAVKKLNRCKRGRRLDLKMMKEFVSHPNLVKLIGYCSHGEQLFLVYEFMHNGNFEDLLSRAVARLPLVTKVKIVVGIARGIKILVKTQDEVRASRRGTVSESWFDRQKIFLDEDFTAKLFGYDVPKLVQTRVNNDDGSSEPFQLRSNLFGFTVVFAEVLMGKRISNEKVLLQYGNQSLRRIAKSCFEICNEVDAESKMLRILEEHDKYISSKSERGIPNSNF